jgi:hypothetical protein
VRDWLNVVGVAAARVPAGVVKFETLRDWAEEEFESCDVCVFVFAVSNIKFSVAMFSI